MLDMDKVVIYGLGKEYSQLKAYLENNYDVIALCDKKNMGGWVRLPHQNYHLWSMIKSL